MRIKSTPKWLKEPKDNFSNIKNDNEAIKWNYSIAESLLNYSFDIETISKCIKSDSLQLGRDAFRQNGKLVYKSDIFLRRASTAGKGVCSALCC